MGLERIKYPQFGGKLNEYPCWKEDWQLLIHPKLDEPTELLKLREAVPKLAKVELRSMRTLAAAWQFLDSEYGREDWLSAERVAYLHAFKVSKSAMTDAAKLKELHAVWREVYTDLDKIGAAGNPDNALAIETFVRKFPLEAQRAYVRLKSDQTMVGKKESEIMNKFMLEERE